MKINEEGRNKILSKKFGWVEFLAGFATGSVISVLVATKKETSVKEDFTDILKKSEEIKNLLLKKAKDIASEVTERSHRFIESAKKYSDGRYAGTIESLENEYYVLKYAINTAVDNYKRKARHISYQESGDDLFIDFEDETVPKFVGMGKRKR